jgi:hypothetical protein
MPLAQLAGTCRARCTGGVSVGDLGHPRAPLALLHAVVTVQWRRKVAESGRSMTQSAPAVARWWEAVAGGSGHLRRGCGVGSGLGSGSLCGGRWPMGKNYCPRLAYRSNIG